MEQILGVSNPNLDCGLVCRHPSNLESTTLSAKIKGQKIELDA